MTIYKYYPGYRELVLEIESNTVDENLKHLDSLYGRDNLSYGASDEDVKHETLRQLEIEYRKEVDDTVTFWVDVANAQEL